MSISRRAFLAGLLSTTAIHVVPGEHDPLAIYFRHKTGDEILADIELARYHAWVNSTWENVFREWEKMLWHYERMPSSSGP